MSKFEELTWQEIDELPRDRTIIFVPIGPLEEHGPHLAVGMDFLASLDTAVEGAKLMEKQLPELVGVVTPVIPLGTAYITNNFPGTISIRPKAIKFIIADFCSGFAKDGFRFLVICNQHLSLIHLKALRAGMKITERKYGASVVEPLTPILFQKAMNKNDPIWGQMSERVEGDVAITGEMHADVKETAYMMYRYPQLVKEKIRKTLEPVKINLIREIFSRPKDARRMGNGLGYFGSPAQSTSALGQLYFDKVVEIYAQAAIGLYRGEKPQEIPKLLKAAMKVMF